MGTKEDVGEAYGAGVFEKYIGSDIARFLGFSVNSNADLEKGSSNNNGVKDISMTTRPKRRLHRC